MENPTIFTSLSSIASTESTSTSISTSISKSSTSSTPLKRNKTSTYKMNFQTKVLTDVLKDIHELNDYEKEYKRPILYNEKYYLKSSVNNNIFDYENENKLIGIYDVIHKKINFIVNKNTF